MTFVKDFKGNLKEGKKEIESKRKAEKERDDRLRNIGRKKTRRNMRKIIMILISLFLFSCKEEKSEFIKSKVMSNNFFLKITRQMMFYQKS